MPLLEKLKLSPKCLGGLLLRSHQLECSPMAPWEDECCNRVQDGGEGSHPSLSKNDRRNGMPHGVKRFLKAT